MAQKAATVFLIDVAPSMQIKQEGDDKTYLQHAIDAVASMIQDKLLSGRKSDMVGITLLGTEETDNIWKEGQEGYENITTLSPIATPDNDLVKRLLNTTASKEPLTDILSGLILAVWEIHKHCRTLKYVKRMILFTDAESDTDWQDLSTLTQQLEKNNVTLIIILAGCDENSGANISDYKAHNLEQIKHLAQKDNVELLNLKDALDQLSTFKARVVNPTPVFRGDLMLGSVEEHPHETMVIPVQMYARTYEAKMHTAKKWSSLSELHRELEFPTHDVGKEVTFKIKGKSNSTLDNEASEAQTADSTASASTSASAAIPTSAEQHITNQDLERAYPFGKSLVVITEEDEKFMKLSTKAGMHILGFLNADKVPRDYFMSNVYVVIPRPPENQMASLSLSALARALYEKNAYALVRYVAKDDQQPKLGVLMPYFEPKVDALHFVRIPFAEDIRQFPFAPLDVVMLPNGKKVTEHPNLLTKELEDAMDAFVSKMQLPLEEDDKPSFSPEKIFNPAIWRLNEAIKHRSLNKAAPIPDLHPALKLQLESLPLMMESAREEITKLKEVAGVHKVDENAGKKRRYGKGNQPEEAIAPVEDIVKNEEEALKRYKVKQIPQEGVESEEGMGLILSNTSHIRKVGPIDPIRDFKAMIDNEQDDLIAEAVQQMSEQIEQLVKESFADQYFEKALNCLKVLRDECKKFEEGVQFNDLCHRLKTLCDPSNPQSQRLDFWKLMVKENITLLSHHESADVNVSKEDSNAFLVDVRTQTSQKSADEDASMEDREDDFSADNLLDMLE